MAGRQGGRSSLLWSANPRPLTLVSRCGRGAEPEAGGFCRREWRLATSRTARRRACGPAPSRRSVCLAEFRLRGPGDHRMVFVVAARHPGRLHKDPAQLVRAGLRQPCPFLFLTAGPFSGVSPGYDSSLCASPNRPTSSTAAANLTAVTGPTPGAVINSWHVGSDTAAVFSSSSAAKISVDSVRSIVSSRSTYGGIDPAAAGDVLLHARRECLGRTTSDDAQSLWTRPAANRSTSFVRVWNKASRIPHIALRSRDACVGGVPSAAGSSGTMPR